MKRKIKNLKEERKKRRLGRRRGSDEWAGTGRADRRDATDPPKGNPEGSGARQQRAHRDGSPCLPASTMTRGVKIAWNVSRVASDVGRGQLSIEAHDFHESTLVSQRKGRTDPKQAIWSN